MVIMKSLDRILELLGNIEQHSFEEIKKEISLPDEKLNEALRFLNEYGYVSRDNHCLRITRQGLKFLELPP